MKQLLTIFSLSVALAASAGITNVDAPTLHAARPARRAMTPEQRARIKARRQARLAAMTPEQREAAERTRAGAKARADARRAQAEAGDALVKAAQTDESWEVGEVRDGVIKLPHGRICRLKKESEK